MNSVSEILEKTLRRLPSAKKIREQILIDCWPQAVGEHIAAKSRAIFIEDGTLFVWVKDSVWAQHLSLQKIQIMRSLNRSAKTRMLRDIRFQVGGKRPAEIEEPVSVPVRDTWRDVLLEEDKLAAVNRALCAGDLPPDLTDSLRQLLISQEKRLNWLQSHGCQACPRCGLPAESVQEGDICHCCSVETPGKQ